MLQTDRDKGSERFLNPQEDSYMGRPLDGNLGLWERDTADQWWPSRVGSLGIDTLTSLLYLPDFLQVLPTGRTWLEARKQGDLLILYI